MTTFGEDHRLQQVPLQLEPSGPTEGIESRYRPTLGVPLVFRAGAETIGDGNQMSLVIVLVLGSGVVGVA